MVKLFVIGLLVLVVVSAVVRMAELVAVVLVIRATLAAVSRTWRDRRSMDRFRAYTERLRGAVGHSAGTGRRVFYAGVNHPGSPSWFDAIDAESREARR